MNAVVSALPSRRGRSITLVLLLALLLAAAAIATTIGSAGIPLERLAAALGLGGSDPAMLDRDRLGRSACRASCWPP
jgi:iron complex transport system permease protein